MKKILIFTTILTILTACSDNDVDTNSSTADTTNHPEIKASQKKGSPEYYQNLSEDNLWALDDKEDSLAQYTLGTIYYRGGDYVDAYKLFMSAVGIQETAPLKASKCRCSSYDRIAAL